MSRGMANTVRFSYSNGEVYMDPRIVFDVGVSVSPSRDRKKLKFFPVERVALQRTTVLAPEKRCSWNVELKSNEALTSWICPSFGCRSIQRTSDWSRRARKNIRKVDMAVLRR